MVENKLIPALKKRLQLPLPGKNAQYRMATTPRKPYKHKKVPEQVRLASVLCLLYAKNDQWHFPLIQRVVTHKDKHSGQMSFPGGKVEPTDHTLQYSALREAHEEIGVLKEDVDIIGSLTPLYIPVSNFHVHPFIGFLNYTPTFRPQLSEVAEVVEVSLNSLLAPTTKKQKSMSFQNKYQLKNVPYFDVNKKTVWGATAMMLNELVEIIHQLNNSTIKNT